MVTKTQQEIDEMKELMQRGELPPTALADYHKAEALNVYGYDAKRKGRGGYIEQGLGSAGNQTRNSVEAYRKHGKGEPDYAAHLARMEKELAECNERRRQKADDE